MTARLRARCRDSIIASCGPVVCAPRAGDALRCARVPRAFAASTCGAAATRRGDRAMPAEACGIAIRSYGNAQQRPTCTTVTRDVIMKSIALHAESPVVTPLSYIRYTCRAASLCGHMAREFVPPDGNRFLTILIYCRKIRYCGAPIPLVTAAQRLLRWRHHEPPPAASRGRRREGRRSASSHPMPARPVERSSPVRAAKRRRLWFAGRFACRRPRAMRDAAPLTNAPARDAPA